MSDQVHTETRPEYIARTHTVEEIVSDLQQASLWLKIAAFAAFVASSFFVVKYFVGGQMTPALWTWEQWVNAFLGLGLTAIITMAQAFLYAKGYKGVAAVIATFIVVFFGLFSEVSQSMERGDEIVRVRSIEDPVFKQTQAAIQKVAENSTNLGNSPALQSASQLKADAQGRLTTHKAEYNLCAEKYSGQKRIQQCQNYESQQIAKAQGDIQRADSQMNSAQSSIALSTQATNTTLENLINKSSQLSYNNDQHQYAMIKFLRELFGLTALWASFLFSFIIIGCFEYAFHFIGHYVADHRTALKLLGFNSKGEKIATYAININAPELNPEPPKPTGTDTPKATKKDNVTKGHFGQSSNYGGNAFASANHLVSAPTPVPAVTPTFAGNTALNPVPYPQTLASVTAINTHPKWQPGRPEVQLDIEDYIAQQQANLPQESSREALQTFTGSPTNLPVKASLEKVGEGIESGEGSEVRNAYLEILRAVHHGLIKNPSFPQCKRVLVAAKIGTNSNDREALIFEVMEYLLKPESVVIDHPKRGEDGHPNWEWHPNFKRQPENWNTPDYQLKESKED